MLNEFPQTFKGAYFICSFEKIACYSDKEVETIEDSIVTFKDGSIVKLQSRKIYNKRTGKIILKTIDDSFIVEHIIND